MYFSCLKVFLMSKGICYFKMFFSNISMFFRYFSCLNIFLMSKCICHVSVFAMFTGICKRLLTDLTTLAPSVHWKLFAPTQRHLCVWKGGSVLGSLSTFHQLCVTQEEFKDQGSRALKAKFT